MSDDMGDSERRQMLVTVLALVGIAAGTIAILVMFVLAL